MMERKRRSHQKGRPRVETAAAAAALSSIRSVLKDFSKIQEDREDSARTNTSSFAVQLHRCFTEDTISATDDPYKYWGINCQRFHGFGAAVALKCLHMPRTSVVSVSDLPQHSKNILKPSLSKSYWSGIYPWAFCTFWW